MKPLLFNFLVIATYLLSTQSCGQASKQDDKVNDDNKNLIPAEVVSEPKISLKEQWDSIANKGYELEYSLDRIESGKILYARYCSKCHGDSGQGTAAPNLTDSYSIHGFQNTVIARIIAEGLPGMPAYSTVYNPKEVRDLVAYVHSLKGTNYPNGKYPEGDYR